MTSRAFHPTSAEVAAHVRELRARHPRLVSIRTLARTAGGRPILAATVTDPDSRSSGQQHVLVTAGQHGNEESGRLVALALLDWLVLPAAAETRRCQRIVVLPNANPDGAEADSHGTPAGIQPNLDHGPGGAQTPEGRAVEIVAERLQPELYVDLHARGHAGCSYDMVLYPWTRNYTEDDNLCHAIAADMAAAGERAGVPHMTHPLTWWTPETDEPSTTLYLYRRFKSIVMLTENAESNEVAYPSSISAASGLAKLKALLAWGNRRFPKLPYDGYPNPVVAGLFPCGVLAVGRDAAARRRCRVAAWQEADGFARVSLRNPEQPLAKVLQVRYTGRPLAAIGFVLAAAGRLAPVAATWDGQTLHRSETNGFFSWQAGRVTYAAIAVRNLQPGEHEATVQFRRM
jgi:hypothetical protein